MLSEVHAQSVLALSPACAYLAWSAMRARFPSFPPPPTPPDPADPEAFLDRIVAARLDHAAVVLPVCRDASALAVPTLETLIGHAIQRLEPRGKARPPREPSLLRAMRRAASGSPSSPTPQVLTDTRTVLSVVPNPKKPGTASYLRYESYRVGETVAQAGARGLTTADLKWDLERGFVTLGV